MNYILKYIHVEKYMFDFTESLPDFEILWIGPCRVLCPGIKIEIGPCGLISKAGLGGSGGGLKWECTFIPNWGLNQSLMVVCNISQ